MVSGSSPGCPTTSITAEPQAQTRPNGSDALGGPQGRNTFRNTSPGRPGDLMSNASAKPPLARAMCTSLGIARRAVERNDRELALEAIDAALAVVALVALVGEPPRGFRRPRTRRNATRSSV